MKKFIAACSVLIVILIIMIIWFIKRNKFIENMDSTTTAANTTADSEAIQNIASVYNGTTMTVKDINITGTLNILPKGIITAWSGSITSIPKSWTICDGTNGTPDLRGRFILGYGQGSGLTMRNLNTTGGEETHKLTIAEMPAHTHGYNDWYWSENQGQQHNWIGSNKNDHDNDPIGSDRTSYSTGGNGVHNTMPPFYVLAYIMKL